VVAVAGYLLEGALFGGLAEDFSLHIVVIIVGEGRQGPRRRRRRARRRGCRRLRAELQPVPLHRGFDGGPAADWIGGETGQTLGSVAASRSDLGLERRAPLHQSPEPRGDREKTQCRGFTFSCTVDGHG